LLGSLFAGITTGYLAQCPLEHRESSKKVDTVGGFILVWVVITGLSVIQGARNGWTLAVYICIAIAHSMEI